LRIDGKVWVGGEAPRLVVPGLSAYCDSPRRMVAGGIGSQIPSVIACSAAPGTTTATAVASCRGVVCRPSP
jgi:hypothetical protein